MKRNREELEKAINNAIVELHDDYSIDIIKEKAINDLQEYFHKGRVIQIFNKSIKLQTLSELDLYNIALFLNDNNKAKINLDEYFHKEEIDEAVNPRVIKLDEYKNGISLNNVLFNGDKINQQYITMLSYQEIAKLHECGAVGYNFATQRRANIVKHGNKSIREAMINMKSVNEIRDSILDGTFQTNTITWNIRNEGNESHDYDSQQSKLVIHKAAHVDNLDGQHRTCGIHQAWKINPNIEGNMIINIKNLTIEEARFFISQEARGNVNNQEEMKLYDPNGNLEKLIYDINTDRSKNNILYNRISDGVENKKVLVYNETFSYNLRAAWAGKLDDVSTRELKKIKEFIVGIYSIMYDEFMKNRNVESIDDLKDDIVLDHMFLSGILYVASKLYGVDKNDLDVNKVDRIIEKIEAEENKLKFVYNDENNRYEVEPYKKAWRELV